MEAQDLVGNWRLDPTRSTFTFRSPLAWGLVKVKGTFDEADGTGEATSPDQASGQLSIDVASVSTGIGKRDEHLRSADFFDVEKFPTIDVTVDSAEVTEPGPGPVPAALTLHAQFTIKGVAHRIDLPAKASLLDDGAVRIVAKGALERLDFGVGDKMMGIMGDTTAVEATAVFAKQS